MNIKPNFLFLFSDQHRGDWLPYDMEIKARLGVESLDLRMPNIRGLMDRGTTFTCALSPAPICAPARACLASGMRYKNCRVDTNNVNYDYNLNTFYKELQSDGYYVCGVGKFDLNKADLYWGDGYHEILKRTGFTYAQDSEGKMDTIWAAMKNEPGPYGRMLQEESWLEKHKEDMINRVCNDYPTPLPDELYADNWITQRGLQMLRETPVDRPWFMQVNFSGPHDPWDITESMKNDVRNRTFPDAVNCSFTDENQGVRQNYAAMMENIDRNIGMLLNLIKERGDLNNTIIVYSSDHGEMMGDHSLYGKAKPYRGSVHIPMVVDASHIDGVCHQYNHTPVELQDLAMTFLDYAGLPADNGMESVSLRSIISGEKTIVRDYAISELINPNPNGLVNTFGVICDGRYKLIMRKGEAHKLYNIIDDPFECVDIADQYSDIVMRMAKAFGERGGGEDEISAAYANAFHLRG